MILPSLGERVRVWPAPDKRVQSGTRTIDSGGRWLASAGAPVVWGAYHTEQLRAGEIMLHPPPCARHEFGSDGRADNCQHCGRTPSEAEQYDAQFSHEAQE